MKKLITIGEALLDFIPLEKGVRLKDVTNFKRVVGGAPTNVAGANAKLGGNSILLTKLGDDAFGHHIIEELQKYHINIDYIKLTQEYDTSLAFVSLAKTGERDFKFYRKTAADLQFSTIDIPDDILDNVGIIHFCSVDLVESPMKEAHKKLISMAKQQNVLVSFDPNLRFSLWDDLTLLKQTVQEFIGYSDIVKISEDELEFITGKNNIEEAVFDLFSAGCKLVIYTKGGNGASIYRNNELVQTKGHFVDVKDTTGGGDSFIGAFLHCILKANKLDLTTIKLDELQQYLDFANSYAAYTVTQFGALSAMADLETFQQFQKTLK